MKILVVGSGGREHALCWKLKRSKRAPKLFCAPGNAGIAAEAECLAVKAEDLDGLVKVAVEKKVDLAVIGPEAPLAAGLADRLMAKGVAVFGASAAAAELEASKAFAKNLMTKYGVPTAESAVFDDPHQALAYVNAAKFKLVVKADGLAAGKGVIVCEDKGQAGAAVHSIMRDRAFGEAGRRVVIEERLFGEEASFLAFTDGERVLPMASAQDHKAIFDNDQGPNTGGMGAYSPAPVVTAEVHAAIMEKIMVPTVRAMAAEGRLYQGVLYAGVMVTPAGPKALEFNARFGDPETQPLLFRMRSDLVDLMEACVLPGGGLGRLSIDSGDPAVCVVMASKGYPGYYQKGLVISGLDRAAEIPDAHVFHAGTALKDGRIVTAGGRVLGVTASGPTVQSAIDRAYQAVGAISWDGAYYRTDIGRKALNR